LRANGIQPDAITRDDVASLDEFHLRGRDATRELARLAGLTAGMRVLDVGCGLGGPARTLATEFGCRVTGVDLTTEFCQIARLLNERLGLGETIEIRNADALDLPVPDGSFDAAVLEHVTMNIADKQRLFREMRRVLRPGGRLALYEICAGTSRPEHLPAPWAESPAMSHLVAPGEMRLAIEAAGFAIREWRDLSAVARDFVRDVLDRARQRPADAPPPVGLNLLVGENGRTKFENLLRNFEEVRIRVVQGVAG
jgi:ubiquinone/menaquinone biosynthesis C-methylase UbiE